MSAVAEDQSHHAWLALIPAVAAVAVGGVYVLGIAHTAAQLNGAGLSVRETLPLVPISAILGRGMAEMIWVTLLFATVGLLAAILWPVTDRTTDPPPPIVWKFSPPKGWWLFFGALAVVWGIGLLKADPVKAVTTAVSLAVIITWSFLLKHNRYRAVIVTIAVGYLIAVLLALLGAYIYPKPLPLAVIRLSDARTFSGGFVAHDGTTWFVTQRRGQVTAVTDRVALVKITTRPLPGRRTLGEILQLPRPLR